MEILPLRFIDTFSSDTDRRLRGVLYSPLNYAYLVNNIGKFDTNHRFPADTSDIGNNSDKNIYDNNNSDITSDDNDIIDNKDDNKNNNNNQDDTSLSGSDSSPVIRSVLGIPEIDSIENLTHIRLRPDSTVIQMWGCTNCVYRGTSRCPFGIKKGERHSNGYCTMAIKENLIMSKLMRNSNGMRHLRNMNLVQDYRLLSFYRNKLNDLKSELQLDDEEVTLLNNVIKMTDNLGKRMDKAIEQEDGKTVKVEHDFTPNDFNRLISKANSRIIDVVSDDDDDKDDDDDGDTV